MNSYHDLFLELLGYEDDEADTSQPSGNSSSAVKKQKYCLASDEDWDYLTASDHGKNFQDLNKLLKLTDPVNEVSEEDKITRNINPQNVLFPYIRIIHFALHLVYEDLKLNILRIRDALPLMKFLFRLSADLDLTEYKLFYWTDFPDQVSMTCKSSTISQDCLKNVICHPVISVKPTSIMNYIYCLISGVNQEPYPYLRNVNRRSRDMAQVIYTIHNNNFLFL